MRLSRLLLVGIVSFGLAGAAFLARETERPGARMVSAAEKFLAGLTDEQKKKVTFEFDDKERLRWLFTPQQTADRKPTRKGLPLEDMNNKQKALARDLLRSGTSDEGYKKATTVMNLESILAELEKKGRMVRDPDWYFFTIFGTPSKTGRWGWRVEGHHLSINITPDGGEVVSATPFFLGANPAIVKGGKQKGLVALPESIEPYRNLVASLDNDARKLAQRDKLLGEIEEGKPKINVGEPVGLPAKKMNDKQKAALWKLIEGYANRMPPEVAAHELAAIKKAGLDQVHFAYAVDPKRRGEPHTYRVHGPTFVIEFINEQGDSAGNPANHIHSSWRNTRGDFGLASR